jgi:hypothetical protein
MLPYLIAGAIGYGIAKLLEEDKAPKYEDGGELLSDEMEKHISYLNELLKNNNAGSLKFAIKSIDDIISTETSSIDLQEYKDLKKEIKKNGVVPILIDESDSVIIDGNHRWQLLKKLGIKNIPVFELKANENLWENDNLYMEFEYHYKNLTPLISIYKYADGGGTLLAPNGKPSNLTPEQYKLVRTPEFKLWFGDWENSPETASKVVDENGEPMVVYHGTNTEFYKFDKSKGKGSIKQKSINFSSKKEVSKDYGSRILECFLNIRNPYIKNYNGESYWNIEFNARYEKKFDEIPDQIVNKSFDEKIYDGVIFINIKDSKSRYSQNVLVGNNYYAFKNNQIKLADGTNTTFDANNPDIRYAGGGKIITTHK